MKIEWTTIEPEEAGFTLMELLVAMTLVALMASMILGGMQFGTRVWERSQSTSESVEEIRVVRQLVYDLVARSYPYYHETSKSDGAPPFIGEPQELIFSADAPRQFQLKGLHRFRLRYEQSGTDARTLMLDWIVDRNGRRDPRYDAATESKVLLDQVEKFELEYFDGVRWGNRWNAKNGLPELVRVNLKREFDERDWVPLVVHPRIDMDSQCQYDPVSRNCRRR